MLQVRKRCMALRVARQNFQNCDLKTHANPRRRNRNATNYVGEAITGVDSGPSHAIAKQKGIADFRPRVPNLQQTRNSRAVFWGARASRSLIERRLILLICHTAHQFVSSLHQPQLQHLSFDRDVGRAASARGDCCRSRRKYRR